MFLTVDDFTTVIVDDKLQKIIIDAPTILDTAITLAVAEATAYLSNRYDIASIFNKTASDRDAYLVMLVADIALYHLYSRIPARNAPPERAIRYNEAKDFLIRVNRGQTHLDLTLKEVVDVKNGMIVFGGDSIFRF